MKQNKALNWLKKYVPYVLATLFFTISVFWVWTRLVIDTYHPIKKSTNGIDTVSMEGYQIMPYYGEPDSFKNHKSDTTITYRPNGSKEILVRDCTIVK